MSSSSRLLRRQIRCKRRELRKLSNELPSNSLKRELQNKSSSSFNNYSNTFANVFKAFKTRNINSPFLSQLNNNNQYNYKNILSGGYSVKQLRFTEELRNKYGSILTSMIIR